MLSSLEHESPVIYLEHKLLSSYWLDLMGVGGRTTVEFDVPSEGIRGSVPDVWSPVPLGKAALRSEGQDITLVSVAVGVHRCIEVAAMPKEQGISAGILDLRTVSPLDCEALCEAVGRSGRLLVVDEDYQDFGLSGEIAAVILESGIKAEYARVCTQGTIPYASELEDQVLPNIRRILDAGQKLLEQ